MGTKCYLLVHLSWLMQCPKFFEDPLSPPLSLSLSLSLSRSLLVFQVSNPSRILLPLKFFKSQFFLSFLLLNSSRSHQPSASCLPSSLHLPNRFTSHGQCSVQNFLKILLLPPSLSLSLSNFSNSQSLVALPCFFCLNMHHCDLLK